MMVLTTIFLLCASYEVFVALGCFFSKRPNMGLGIGATACGFLSGLFAIWVATFDLAFIDVGIALVITILVMVMAMCIRSAKKESQ